MHLAAITATERRQGARPAGPRRLLPALLLAPLLAWAPALAPRARAAAPDTTGITFDQHPGAALPDEAAFLDQDGRPVTLGALRDGRPLVLALGYFSCPALCGIVRDDLFAALSASGLSAATDYRLLFVSIDPAETPADARQALADDLARYPTEGAREGWRFLTGPRASIDALEAAVGYHSRFDAGLKQFIHPAGVVLATPDDRVSGYLMGVGYAAGDLRAAVKRAGGGGIEAAAQPVLLLCFHFDPATGRYSLAIMKVLRLAGALTVLTIGGLVAVLWRRQRRA